MKGFPQLKRILALIVLLTFGIAGLLQAQTAPTFIGLLPGS